MTKAKQVIRILVADDHAIFRDGLRKLLEAADEIQIVGEASNGVECVKMLGKLKPDILLLDLRMPEKDGLGVLEEVNFDSLPTRVIVLTAEVIDAFKKSAESGQRREKPLLSDREKEIVQLVAQGFRNREIGEKLFISEQTVKNHLHNIFDKLGVSDRLELALYAIHHRLIDQA